MRAINDLKLPDALGIKVWGRSGNITLCFFGYRLRRKVYVYNIASSLKEVHDFLKAAGYHNYLNTYIKEMSK